MNLASITHDLADLIRTLRNPQHPTGATEDWSPHAMPAIGTVPATTVNRWAAAARDRLDLAAPRHIGTGWYQPTPAPSKES